MDKVEKERLIEILFYLYFNNKDSKMIGKSEFWNAIIAICKLYDIDSLAISKAIRILTAPENEPNSREIYYLLNKLGLSVRPINRISGVYWQRQKEYLAEFEAGKLPKIKSRLHDVVMKKSILDFVFAINDFIGIYRDVNLDDIRKI